LVFKLKSCWFKGFTKLLTEIANGLLKAAGAKAKCSKSQRESCEQAELGKLLSKSDFP
jgi:hypothetical protein